MGRYSVGDDGVSYLDIGDAYMRGDWRNAINAHWSPLYSWVLGGILRITRPSPFWESNIVDLANFLLYVCALGAFEFLLRQAILFGARRDDPKGEDNNLRLPSVALLALGYSIFIWFSLQWITVSLDAPDMTLAIFLYLATGLLIRIRTMPELPLTFLLLGGVLGLAYLTRVVMFPLSFVFLIVAFFAVGNAARARQVIALALVSFALVAGPWIVALSTAKGRLTIGDTGKNAYSWFANGESTKGHWNREFPDDKRPVHPTTRLLETPALYAFGERVAGTYPPWYDPSYWHEGVRPRFELRGQLRVLRSSARVWWRMFVTDGRFLLFGSAILLYVGFRGWPDFRRNIRPYLIFIVPSLAAITTYSLVLLSLRYIAAFTVLFWLGVFASVRLPISRETKRLAVAVPIAIVFMMTTQLALPHLETTYSLARSYGEEQNPTGHDGHHDWRIAQEIRRLGARAGDKVAVIGYGARAYWARLAGVRIVAEVFSEEEEFNSVPGIERMLLPDGSLKPEVLRAFAMTGARFIIARHVPPNVARRGWEALGDTHWYAYILQK